MIHKETRATERLKTEDAHDCWRTTFKATLKRGERCPECGWSKENELRSEIDRLFQSNTALLKAAKEAEPWLQEMFEYVEDEWGRIPQCKWATEKLEVQKAMDNLRAAVALAEGGK